MIKVELIKSKVIGNITFIPGKTPRYNHALFHVEDGAVIHMWGELASFAAHYLYPGRELTAKGSIRVNKDTHKRKYTMLVDIDVLEVIQPKTTEVTPINGRFGTARIWTKDRGFWDNNKLTTQQD